ncbi:Holin [Mycetocola tolaasinivorans]|uniref:Holin n=1 Tax=Mycetocola tolaasinivorans TaxID=76635 RepID=A0A3L7A4W7_9MICO|nr:holin [Mycetocola tolaasinivorans]RLP74342.1 Holin [Mycetocola tolaasinivorans]
MDYLTKDFWIYAGERAIKTFAQTAVAVIGTGAIGIIDVDWAGVVSASTLAGVVSLLTSVYSHERTPGKRAQGGS